MRSNKAIQDAVNAPAPTEERRKYKLPRDPNKATQEMMKIIDRLKFFMVEETKALVDADTATFMTLQDNKLDVARDYVEAMQQMMDRSEEIKKATPTLLDQLEKMRTEFAEIAQANHAALERMKNGMQRLGERIMETARETVKKEKQIIYGASGHMQTGMKATIGINESA